MSSDPADPATRVAIIGRGEVGITLGRRLVQAGWSVQFGSRNPDEVSLPSIISITPYNPDFLSFIL